MIGRISFYRRPLYFLGMLPPALRAAQLSPLAARRLKHGTGDSGEEPSAKTRHRLRQVKPLDSETTSGLNTDSMGHAEKEATRDAKEDCKEETLSEAKKKRKAFVSKNKNKPLSDAKGEAFPSDSSPLCDVFTTEVPQERRQESPFVSRPELPMEGQPASPTKISPVEVNPKSPYPTVTCQQDESTPPSNAEDAEDKVKISGRIIFKDNSTLLKTPKPKEDSMNVWSEKTTSEEATPEVMDTANKDSDPKDGKRQIVLEFETETPSVDIDASMAKAILKAITKNKTDKKEAKIEDLYPSTPQGYEIGGVADQSDIIQQSGNEEQAVEAISYGDTNQISSTAENEEQAVQAIEAVDPSDKIQQSVNEEQAVEAIASDDTNQISCAAENEERAVEDVEKGETNVHENPEERAFQSPTNKLSCKWVNSDGSPANSVESLNELQTVEAIALENPSLDDTNQRSPKSGNEEQAVEAMVLDDTIQISSTANNEDPFVEAVDKTETNAPENPLIIPTNRLPLRIVGNEDDSHVEPTFTRPVPSSELMSDRDAPPEEPASWKSKSKGNPEFIKAVLNSDGEMEYIAPTSLDSSPEESFKKAEEKTSETNELQSEVKGIQLEEQELQSEIKELISETKGLLSEMNELQSDRTEPKSESTEAISASQSSSQSTAKSAAEIISMMEQKQKDTMSFASSGTSDHPSKSTSQIVAAFGLRPEPGQGFRVKGQLNKTELDMQADEYFGKMNKPETSEQKTTNTESETSELAKEMLLHFAKLNKQLQSDKKAEEYFERIDYPETSESEWKMEAELEKEMESEFDKNIEKMEQEILEVRTTLDRETSQLSEKVDKVETPEETNRKAEEYFDKIDAQDTLLERQVEELPNLVETMPTMSDEMSTSSTSKEYFEEFIKSQHKDAESSKTDHKAEAESSEMDNTMEPEISKTDNKRKADVSMMDKKILNKMTDNKIGAESWEMDNKMETESLEFDYEMETEIFEMEIGSSMKDNKMDTGLSMMDNKIPEETKSVDEIETSRKKNANETAGDKKTEGANEKPSDNPLFVPPDEKDRVKAKKEMAKTVDPVTDSKYKTEKGAAMKPKLADGELDLKVLLPEENQDAPEKQNFVQYIVEKIFRKKKTPPKGRTMSTNCPGRDLNTSSTRPCPEDNDIFDDPFSPEKDKVIDPSDVDFISPDLERQGLGSRAIREDRGANREQDHPQAKKKNATIGVWSTRKPKTPLNHQPGMKMSTYMFASNDKDLTQIRGGSQKCKKRGETLREKLMKKSEQKEKIEILGGSQQCCEKLQKLKEESKDDDCKSSYSSYIQGFTKML